MTTADTTRAYEPARTSAVPPALFAMATWTDREEAQVLACAGDDGALYIWYLRNRSFPIVTFNPSTIRALATWTGPEGGQLLASAGDDGTLYIHDPVPGTPAVITSYSRTIRALATWTGPEGGQLLASAGDDGIISIWDLSTGSPAVIPPLIHTGTVRALATWTGPEGGQLLASAGDDHHIRIWDLSAGTSATIADHTGTVRALAAWTGPEGGRLASAGDDGKIPVIELSTLTSVNSVAKLQADRPGAIQALATWTSPEGGRLLASAGDDGIISIWDLSTGSPAVIPMLIHPGTVRALATWTDPEGGQLLASAGDASIIPIWDLSTGTPAGAPLSVPTLPAADVIDQARAPDVGDRAADTDELVRTTGGQTAEADVEESLGGGYDADDADGPDRKDALGFNDDVKMLCSVLADKTAQPPLSLGLFGEWGSGKSFFMRLMRQRIEKLCTVAYEAEHGNRETRYCSHVVQITFNAWHYMDANLWASLAVEIFFRLASPPRPGLAAPTDVEEERARIEQQREQILRRLDTCRLLVAELAETRQRAEQERERVENELAKAQCQRKDKVRDLAEVVAGNVAKELQKDSELTKFLTGATEKLGMSEVSPLELPGLVGDLRKLSGQVGVTWRLLAKRKGKGAWAFGLAATFVVTLLVGLVLLATPGSRVPGATSIAVALATMTGFAAIVRPVLATISNGLDMAESALRREETIEQEFQERQTRKRVELEAELERLGAREQSLATELAEATAREAEAMAEEKDLRAGRRLRRFLEERSGSSDYRGHLGLISLLHQDFQKLSTLLQLAGDDKDDEIPRIDRIILYVDDLDRCPPNRVVEVLEAMYLLLALPLFVVVVGVDPRWLLRSLQRHYRDLLTAPTVGRAASGDVSHWASTPQDYLEKIFQIPFALMPMTSVGFAQLVDDIAGEGASQPSTDGQTEGPRTAASNRDDAAPATPGTRQALTATATGNQGSDRTESRVADPDTAAPRTADGRDHHPSAHDADRSATPSPFWPGGEDEPTPAAPQLVEDQRIFIEEGSIASPEDHIDPNPAGLTLTDYEIRFIQALAPMVTTPRAGKRLVNIYRMIRSTQATGGSSRFLELGTGDGDYQAVLQLLAIVSGFPELAAPTFVTLLRSEPSSSWSAVVDALPVAGPGNRGYGRLSKAQDAEWGRMQAGLVAVRNKVGVPDELGPYCEWAPRVARFSFAAAHLIGKTATVVPTPSRPG